MYYGINHDSHISGSQISSHRNEKWFAIIKHTYEELLRPFVSVISIRSLEVNNSAHVFKERAKDNQERGSSVRSDSHLYVCRCILIGSKVQLGYAGSPSV